MQKFLWTLTIALVSTAAAALSVRLLDRAYRRVTKHPPPEVPKWARLLVSPIRKQVANKVEPG
jgi:peptidoglycan/LPS O-acetylase OafA/YrhL